MTDLILMIAFVGFLFVIAVFGYNMLQERKFKKDAEARFGSPTKDALLGEEADDFKLDSDAAIIEDDANFYVSSMNVEVQEHTDSGIMESFKAELYEKSLIESDELKSLSANPVANSEKSSTDGSVTSTKSTNSALTKPSDDAENANFTEKRITSDELSSGEELSDIAAKNNILVTQKPNSTPEYFSQRIDYLAEFNFKHHVIGAKLKSQFAKFGRIKNSYKVFIAAPNGNWQTLESLHLEAPYIAACAGLQIADRAGVVRAEVIEYFANLSAEIAEQLSADVTLEQATDAIERADHLDKFCMTVDQLVSFNLLESASPFSGTKLRGLLEANGFELNANGLFTYKNEASDVLFSVQTIDGQPFNTLMLKTMSISGIKFLLDLPHVKSGVATFNQMVLVAKQMESSLQARLLDEQNKPMTEAHIDKIRNQIKLLHEKMTLSQVVPGGDLAKRLFA